MSYSEMVSQVGSVLIEMVEPVSLEMVKHGGTTWNAAAWSVARNRMAGESSFMQSLYNQVIAYPNRRLSDKQAMWVLENYRRQLQQDFEAARDVVPVPFSFDVKAARRSLTGKSIDELQKMLPEIGLMRANFERNRGYGGREQAVCDGLEQTVLEEIASRSFVPVPATTHPNDKQEDADALFD